MTGNPLLLVIVAGIMFAVLGGVTLLSHIYSLNGIKSKTVGDGQHGTARWATKAEIKKIYKHVKLVTSSGSAVATYEYDAWGNILSKSGTMADKNPLRYRGYYYDAETGFYYLQSRYYLCVKTVPKPQKP